MSTTNASAAPERASQSIIERTSIISQKKLAKMSITSNASAGPERASEANIERASIESSRSDINKNLTKMSITSTATGASERLSEANIERSSQSSVSQQFGSKNFTKMSITSNASAGPEKASETTITRSSVASQRESGQTLESMINPQDDTGSESVTTFSTASVKSLLKNEFSISEDLQIHGTNIQGKLSDTGSKASRSTMRSISMRASQFSRNMRNQSMMEKSSQDSAISKSNLQNMSNSVLLQTVEDLQTNTKYLELENNIFVHFLEKNDPSLLEGMGTILSGTLNKDHTSITSKRLTLSRRSTLKKDSGGSYITDTSSFSMPTALEKEVGNRINVTQKTDLVLREMEEIVAYMEVINKKFYRLKHKTKSQLEEMSIRETELQETVETFENVFITCTVEKYIQKKNPADKFIRYMEEWFKTAGLTVDKIRLRTSSLKVQYQKICNQLLQKQLLGENLQRVDFEQLHIENKHLVAKIDQRNLLLMELKRMNGKANLLLSQNKKQLLIKLNELQGVKNDIARREEGLLKFDQDLEKVSTELEKTKEECDKIRTKTEIYEVPGVVDYVKKKAELGILKKNLKVWTRRKQIKDMALIACIREIKHVTGKSTVDPSWFLDPRKTYIGRGSLETTFEFEFQRSRRNSDSEKMKILSSRRLTTGNK